MRTRHGWEILEGMTCVVCPECAFGMGVEHTDEPDGDSYTCPVCAPPEAPEPMQYPSETFGWATGALYRIAQGLADPQAAAMDALKRIDPALAPPTPAPTPEPTEREGSEIGEIIGASLQQYLRSVSWKSGEAPPIGSKLFLSPPTQSQALEFVRECANGAYPDSDKESLLEWMTGRAKAILAAPQSQDREPDPSGVVERLETTLRAGSESQLTRDALALIQSLTKERDSLREGMREIRDFTPPEGTDYDRWVSSLRAIATRHLGEET